MTTTDPEHDPVVRELRGRIDAADRAILAAAGERVRLVRELHAHKLERGYGFLDSGREERLLAALARENPGPLSEEGLRELFGAVLDVVKREVAGERAAPG